MTENLQKVLEHRVTSLEKAYAETSLALKGINDSLRTLAAMEARHSETRNDLKRISDSLRDHELRVRAIEAEMPQAKLVAKYVIAGVVGAVALVGTTLIKLVTTGSGP